MARLPAGAIRRALSAMLSDIGQGARGGADAGAAYGGVPGAALGGIAGASMAEDPSDGGMIGLAGGGAGGMMGGAALGGLLGGGRGAMRGVRSALRELVSEEAPQRAISSIPRRRFTEAELQELVGDVRSPRGSAYDPGGPSSWERTANTQAMRDKLRELRMERRYAADEEEAYDIDLQIAAIERELGLS